MSPSKPRKVCSCRGCPFCLSRCPNTTTGGPCDECKVHLPKRSHRSKAAQTVKDDVYNNPRWIGLRRQVMHEQPWCAGYGDQPCPWHALTAEVHHLKAAVDYPALAFARDNVVGLCSPCHARESQRERRDRREKP